MIAWSDLPVLGSVAFVAALLGSVAGSGGSAVLMPVLVLYLGIRSAIPVLTIANLAANLSRVWFNRREIVLPVVGWFVLGAIPTALAGALLFTVAPPGVLTRGLGAFLIAIVLWRRVRLQAPTIAKAAWFAPLGAAFGLLAGLLEGVGPLMAPFFLAHGLLRGAYIGTDALATVFMQISKLAVFGSAALLGPQTVTAGLLLVPFMITGTLAGKLVVKRISERTFVALIDITLVVAGVGFLVAG
ncbi:MAG: sulfite exporter TauE/SafE family protein [bacterium]